MKIRDLQTQITDILNGIEELVQGRYKAFAEDSLTVLNDVTQQLQLNKGVAIIVLTPKATGAGRTADGGIKLGNNKFLAELDAFDGSTFMMQIAIQADGPKLWTFFKTFLPTTKKIKASLKGTPSGVHP